jgi:hypothetical protein
VVFVWSDEARRLGLAQPEPSTPTRDEVFAWAKWTLRDIPGAVPLMFEPAPPAVLYVLVPASRKPDAENALRESWDRPTSVFVAFVTGFVTT